MITGASRNYTFRKVDLSIFPGLESPDTPVEARIGEVSVVSGHSKAAQNFLKALMTPLGHYRSDPDFGSEFSRKVVVGGSIYPEELPNIFAIEALRVLDSIIATKGPNDPDDEVIVSAELVNYSVGRGSVEMTIQLQFRNSDTPRVILLPVQLVS